jgi:hypothetical protein
MPRCRPEIVKNGAVSAALVAGVVLVVAACTQQISQQTASPDASPSTPAVNTTPSIAPPPADSPTPVTVPSPATSPSPARLIITSVPFHMGEVGLTYSTVTLGASGGVKPYKWSISSGSLPPGVTVSSGGSTTGKPTTAGTYSFVIRVDDSAGAAAGVSRSIFVFRQIAWTTPRATCSVFGNPVSCTAPSLKYTGGASSAIPKITVVPNPGNPALPAGSTFVAKSGLVTFNIPGPGCNAPNYDSIVTLVLVDQSPCGTGFNCSSGKLSLTIHMSNNC